MIQIRKSQERGHFDHGWLKTYHTFSFSDYHDPDFMGFRSLRVINEDWVQAGDGFDTHPHRDMEILTYVLSGALEHKDSMGNGSVIRPDDLQYMSAGTGVTHSEFNHSKSESVHLLQIWILPERQGFQPRYGQKTFPQTEKRGVLRKIASPDGAEGSIAIHQDASLYACVLGKGEQVRHVFSAGRSGWLQVARGAVQIEGKGVLQAGDGAAIQGENGISLLGAEALAEFLLFDLD